MKCVEKILKYFKNNRKTSIIIGIAAAVLVVALLIFLIFFKPKLDYKNKVVTVVGDKEYTQSDIDAVGDWWTSGNPVVSQEGASSLDK